MINIKHPNKSPEKWFTYPASPDEQYLLRYIPINSIPTNKPLEINEYVVKQAIIDWRGVNGENDEPIACTEENRLAFLRDPSGDAEERLSWIFEMVYVKANFSNLDELLKNSKAPLLGASLTPKQPLAAV